MCCTSSNAVNIVRAIESKKIIFVPDKNLGAYVASMVPEKEIILWDGYCPVHDSLTAEMVRKAKEQYPNAIVAAHPECVGEVLKESDFIGSTKSIIEFVTKSSEKEFIIATEKGVVDRLKKMTHGKKIHLVDSRMICGDMKKITPGKIIDALNNDTYEIHLEKGIIEAAAGCLNKMMEMS